MVVIHWIPWTYIFQTVDNNLKECNFHFTIWIECFCDIVQYTLHIKQPSYNKNHNWLYAVWFFESDCERGNKRSTGVCSWCRINDVSGSYSEIVSYALKLHKKTNFKNGETYTNGKGTIDNKYLKIVWDSKDFGAKVYKVKIKYQIYIKTSCMHERLLCDKNGIYSSTDK